MTNWLLSNCLLAFALALFVIGIVRLFRPSPATAHALWCVVLLKLVSPLGLWWELPVRLPQPEPSAEKELLPLPPVPPVDLAWAAIPAEPLVLLPPAEPFAFETTEVRTATVYQPPFIESAPLPAVTLSTNESTPLQFVGLILLGGACVYFLRQVVSTWRFCRLARLASAAPDALFVQVRRVSADLGVSVPKVGVIRGLPSPVMWTLRKPLLLWPEGLEGSLNRDGREAVLIHELAHLRRRDHWVRWLEVVCGLLHWWNPLFWLARRQIRLNAELACDAWVMATKPEHRRTYAEALLQVCSRSMRVSHAAPVLGIGGDGTRDFQRRLTMIMQNDAPCQLSRWGRAGVLLLVVAFLPSFTLAQQSSAEEKKEIDIVVEKVHSVLEEIPVDVDVELALQSALKETAPVDAEKEKKVKELEAKLADLMKQLAELKGGPKTTEKKELRYEFKLATQPDILLQKIITTGTGKGPDIKVFSKDGKEIKDIKVLATNDGQGAMKFMVVGADGKEQKDVIIFVAQGKELPVPTTVPLPTRTVQGKVQAVPVKVVETTQAVPVKVVEGQRVTEVKGAIEKIATARVILDEKVNPNAVISLTRASYALPKEQAEQLIGMFKDKAKGAVLEMKYEGDKLIVTTTPDIQSVFGNVVNLMTGKPVSSTPRYGVGGMFAAPAQVAPFPSFTPAVPTAPAIHVVPTAPAIHAVPVAPKPPVAPSAPRVKPTEKPVDPEPLSAPRLLAQNRP